MLFGQRSGRSIHCHRDVHTMRRAFEHDRRRDQRLALLGWRVVRFTWRQAMLEPATVASTLRGLLSDDTAGDRDAIGAGVGG